MIRVASKDFSKLAKECSQMQVQFASTAISMFHLLNVLSVLQPLSVKIHRLDDHVLYTNNTSAFGTG